MFFRGDFVPRTPLRRRSRGPIAPLRSGARYFMFANKPRRARFSMSAETPNALPRGLRPPDPLTPSLAGPHRPAPRFGARYFMFANKPRRARLPISAESPNVHGAILSV